MQKNEDLDCKELTMSFKYDQNLRFGKFSVVCMFHQIFVTSILVCCKNAKPRRTWSMSVAVVASVAPTSRVRGWPENKITWVNGPAHFATR